MPRRTPLNQRRIISELNMTPLIDLTFLLLITFMITFPLIEQGIHIRLPKGKAAPLELPDTVSIALDKQGGLFLDNLPTDESALAAELRNRVEIDPDLTILVRADEELAYGKVVAVLRIMHEANITRMALVTDPQAE